MNRRPKLELVHSMAATPEEAAAVIAAVERFLRDTTPVYVASEEKPSEWVRTALLEGVAREPGALVHWPSA